MNKARMQMQSKQLQGNKPKKRENKSAKVIV
jgi:hypothetical protein